MMRGRVLEVEWQRMKNDSMLNVALLTCSHTIVSIMCSPPPSGYFFIQRGEINCRDWQIFQNSFSNQLIVRTCKTSGATWMQKSDVAIRLRIN